MARHARGPGGLLVAKRRGYPETRRAAVDVHGFDARPRRRGRLEGCDRGPQRCLESFRQGQRRRLGQGGRRWQPPSRLPCREQQGCQLAATACRRPERTSPSAGAAIWERRWLRSGKQSPARLRRKRFPSLGRHCAPRVVDSAYFGALLRSWVDRDLFWPWSAKNLVERCTTQVLASKREAHGKIWARARARSCQV